MATERGASTCIVLSAVLLVWPAVWNRYPIVFADTGTYLSQAVHGYLGWDRPPFYSLFILPLHLDQTLWPIVAAQALLTAWILHLLRRTLAPNLSCWWLLPLCFGLAVTTWLPWLVSTVMPDVLTPLLVLAIGLLARGQLHRAETVVLTGLSALFIAAQLSSVLLAAALLCVVAGRNLLRRAPLPAALVAPDPNTGATAEPPVASEPCTASGLRQILGSGPRMPEPPVRRTDPAAAIIGRRLRRLVRTIPRPCRPLLLAVCALLAVNLAGFGRLSLSPFGSVFLLARVIYDGPGLEILHRDCPAAGWRLCKLLDRFPSTSDEFLWSADSPVLAAGGHKAIAAEANAIIRASLLAEPGSALRATLANGWEQLSRFASGDGLNAWPEQVDRWIDRDLPADAAAYHAARQQSGLLDLPPWLAALHQVTAVLGVISGLVWLVVGRRRDIRREMIILSLLTLPVSALITGGLSTPHDRYQSRIAWLPGCVTVCALLGTRRPP